MTNDMRVKRGLGRGLSALMADINTTTEDQAQSPRSLPIEQISPNPDQPRKQFDRDSLNELAASLKQRGVLQPLIVRPHPADKGLFQIVAGERRWRAAQIAQLHELPVIVREMSDAEMLEIALIENIQRTDLNAIEEAISFRQLMDRFGHTQEQLAEALNKSRSNIANVLRLLSLPDAVQDLVKTGKLSAGHARALITAENPLELARKVIEKGLSVRETEALAKDGAARKQQPQTGRSQKAEKDADTRALESDLSAHLRMRVQIEHSGAEGGKLTIYYRDLAQLDQLCIVLGNVH